MNVTEYNNKHNNDIRELIDAHGIASVARRFGVNHYYISKTHSTPGYIPRSTEIATMMGYKVYRTSVPHGKARGKAKRAIIYPGTLVDKIKADLLDVTGIEWQPMIDEMEY